jgi:hypothetical protein
MQPSIAPHLCAQEAKTLSHVLNIHLGSHPHAELYTMQPALQSL